jgi:hypothetical protein
VLFFQLQTWMLALILLAVILAATVVGLLIGRSARKKSEVLREPFSVMQAVLLGFMSLVLAFGLSLAVGRYQDRRAATVDEANAIGTTYLRAETLHEPMRSASMGLLRQYTDVSIRISRTRPDSSAERQAIADSSRLQRQLWDLAGQSLNQAPIDSAPRLYVESLTETFRLPGDPRLQPEQPRSYRGAGTRTGRGRYRAGLAGPSLEHHGPRRVHGPRRSTACRLNAARHLRSRPADTRSDQSARWPTHRGSSQHGPPPSSARADR